MIKTNFVYNLLKILFILGLLFPLKIYTTPTTWQRYYDYNRQQNVGTDVVQTFDGGYIILGGAGGTGSIYLIKTDYLGIKQWDKVISDSSTFIGASSIIQTPDSGFAMTGKRGFEVFLLRTDKIGNPMWIKYFNRTGGDAIGYRIYLENSSEFLIGGVISFSVPSSIKSYVIKTDSEGNFLWDNVFGDSIFASGARIVTTDNGYYATNINYRNTALTNFNGLIYRLDGSGNVIWKKSIGLNKSVEPIILNFPDEIFLAGFDGPGSNYKFYLSRIDTSGIILWQRSYDSAFVLSSICTNANDDFIFAGSKLRDDIQWDFAVTRIDINGNLVYRKLIDTPEGSEDYCYSVKYTHDNGYILVGTTDFASSGFKDENILTVKTDSGFNTSSMVSIPTTISILPQKFTLFQNYPNPFNPNTKITYSLPTTQYTILKVYDVLGKEVMTLINETKEAGNYEVEFNGSNLASGAYFYRIESGMFTSIKRMILIK